MAYVSGGTNSPLAKKRALNRQTRSGQAIQVALAFVLSLVLLTGCRASVKSGAAGTDPSNIKPIVEPPTVVAADPSWFSCKIDKDCMVEEGVCGSDQAVNKAFTTNFYSYRDDMERSVGCINDAPETQIHTAKCVQHRCSLNPPRHRP